MIEVYPEAKDYLEEIPKPKYIKDSDGSLKGTVGTLPPGITKKQSYYAQQLFRKVVIFSRPMMGRLKPGKFSFGLAEFGEALLFWVYVRSSDISFPLAFRVYRQSLAVSF